MALNKPYTDTSQLPSSIPVFPLTGALLLPQAMLPLNIFEPRYMTMTDDAIRTDRLIGMIQPASPASSLQGNPDLRAVGCAGRITQFAETGDGRYVITLTGIVRFRILQEMKTPKPYRLCHVDFREFETDIAQGDDDAINREQIIAALKQFAEVRNMRIDWREIDNANNTILINAMSMMGPFGPEEKQALLEASNLRARGDTLVKIIEFELAQSDLSSPGPLQ